MWLGHHFEGQKVQVQLAGGGVYCGGLPHSLLIYWWSYAWKWQGSGFFLRPGVVVDYSAGPLQAAASKLLTHTVCSGQLSLPPRVRQKVNSSLASWQIPKRQLRSDTQLFTAVKLFVCLFMFHYELQYGQCSFSLTLATGRPRCAQDNLGTFLSVGDKVLVRDGI